MTRPFLALTILLLAVTAPSWGDAPSTISYQGILTDGAGVPVDDGEYTMAFGIYDSPTDPGALWIEQHDENAAGSNKVTVVNGIFNVILGKIEPLNLPFDEPYWLGMSVEGGDELTPRTELAGSPYAFRAARADSALHAEHASVADSALAGGSGGAGDGHSLDAADGDPVDVVYVDDDGLVGIGTATPATALHVATGTDVGLEGGGFLQLGSSGGTNVGIDNNEIMARNNGVPSNLYINREGGKVMIGNEGYVSRLGIGVTSPHRPLHIGADVAAIQLTATGGADATIGADGSRLYLQTQTPHGMRFGTDSQSRMFIDATGNVGIGTEAPEAALDVRGMGGTSYCTIGGIAAAVFARGSSASVGGVWAQRDGVANRAVLAGEDFGVFCDGDLVVYDGAFHGNIGPHLGAPFPRPAYDTGWVWIAQNETSTNYHNLGGNVDDYFVDLIFQYHHGGDLHNIGIGGYRKPDGTYGGAYLYTVDSSKVSVYRYADDQFVAQYRVRIWIIK